MNQQKPLDTLQSIRQRRTVKVISDTPLPIKPCDNDLIETLMESAYYAPFHYPCFAGHQQHQPSPLPWRFYVLDSANCRQLGKTLAANDISMGKILGMLNTADYLIQATWCPLPGTQSNAEFDGNLINMEHIAAASAAVQNILLTATALGHENYWSSGGCLREAFTDELLGIPEAEILLGSLFIFPAEDSLPEQTDFFPSKRRDQRGALADSYRLIHLDN